MTRCEDDDGTSYYGLPTPPPDGWDEVRQPFLGTNYDWERYRRRHSRRKSSRNTTPQAVLMLVNKPWRTPEGNCRYSIEEIDEIQNDILNGTSEIAEINKKETLRCINEANMMFRDTLRDPDEGDACSEASNDAETSPKTKKKKTQNQ